MPLPLGDSWVRLDPGKTFALDAESGNEWKAKTTALRTTRGSVLTFAFEVEHSIDIVISRFFFPDEDPKSEELKPLFDELFLKAPSANFARKIQVFKDLSKQPSLSSLVPPDLLKNFEQIKDLRNRFAHYPIFFDPSDGESTGRLVAKLVCRDKEITLDDAFFKKCGELFSPVEGDLQKILTVFGVNKIPEAKLGEGGF
jgi:hypothetical protein